MARQVRVQRIGVSVPQQRHPLRWLPSWKEIGLGLIIAIVLIVLALAANAAFSRVSDEIAAPAVPAIQQPVAQPVQPAPEVAPVITERPKVQVKWSEPFLVSSLAELPPVEEGFYDGNVHCSEGIPADPNNPVLQYALKVLPQFQSDIRKTFACVSAVHFPNDKKTVFAWIEIDVFDGLGKEYVNEDTRNDHNFYRVLVLSVNGEQTWHEVSPFADPTFTPIANVRMAREGDNATLEARDPDFVAPMWRKATVSLKSLP